MSFDTITYAGNLVVLACWCGMRHAVPEELREYQERQHRDGETQTSIYCPLGHPYVISGPGEAAKERQHREAAEARATALADQLASAERAHASTKGQLTKTKKRVANGVCPCCNRSFANVRRHMSTQHPNYGDQS